MVPLHLDTEEPYSNPALVEVNTTSSGLWATRRLLKPPFAVVKVLRKRIAAGEGKAAVAKAFDISLASVSNYMA